MKYLLLWLEAPLQSWGADSRFDFRKTMGYPVKSGIYGMLLAASGDSGPQEDLLAKMADAPFTVIAFQGKAARMRDFHMVGNGYDKNNPWERMLIPQTPAKTIAVGGGAKLTCREYLQDRVFAVISGLHDELANKFSKALQNPVYDMYLGRKCCVPTDLIFRGTFPSEQDALQALCKIAEEKQKVPKMMITDATQDEIDAGKNVILINDVPVRFGPHKLYRDRWIIEKPWGQPSPAKQAKL